MTLSDPVSRSSSVALLTHHCSKLSPNISAAEKHPPSPPSPIVTCVSDLYCSTAEHLLTPTSTPASTCRLCIYIPLGKMLAWPPSMLAAVHLEMWGVKRSEPRGINSPHILHMYNNLFVLHMTRIAEVKLQSVQAISYVCD